MISPITTWYASVVIRAKFSIHGPHVPNANCCCKPISSLHHRSHHLLSTTVATNQGIITCNPITIVAVIFSKVPPPLATLFGSCHPTLLTLPPCVHHLSSSDHMTSVPRKKVRPFPAAIVCHRWLWNDATAIVVGDSLVSTHKLVVLALLLL